MQLLTFTLDQVAQGLVQLSSQYANDKVLGQPVMSYWLMSCRRLEISNITRFFETNIWLQTTRYTKLVDFQQLLPPSQSDMILKKILL